MTDAFIQAAEAKGHTVTRFDAAMMKSGEMLIPSVPDPGDIGRHSEDGRMPSGCCFGRANLRKGEKRKMGKKIVILNGSPRGKGNTSALIKAFREGAEKAGNTVTEFFLDAMEIHGCKGCFGGHSSKVCPCVQKDDMEGIYPAVKDCDVIVLASPLYYWNMSGQLRTAMDRLFALEEGDGNLLRGNQRACALLMAAEGHGFDDVLLYYDHLMEHLQWKNLGHVLAGGNCDVGDIEGKSELTEAFRLGQSIS